MTDTAMAHGRTSPINDAGFAAVAHFRFFELPPEMRDIIYHWLWKYTPDILLSIGRIGRILRPSRKLTRLTYGSVLKGLQSHGLPVWLLTNKSILAEGLRQLQLHQHHSIGETEIKRLSKIGANFNLLAGLPAATRLSVVGDGYRYIDLLNSGKAVSLYAVSENRQNTFETARMSNLEVLEINLVVAYPYECLQFGQSMDFSFFETTAARLERLNVEIVAETIGTSIYDFMESSANVRKLALAEVTRLGTILVGSGAVVEIHDGAKNQSLDADHRWSIVIRQA
ncbi:hypothetical protein FB567DRAFT_596326 [Paraphoma chrysanthemicola]|uniref:Uncharacterized protein n=1 Tax=Paraphoma chrysanthemicola TaxID=798071 RepID=A0A8K0VV05_9PLEO|nr:hypothetical protein FB567DRAFT_596326 [Paraphoma chrysanthemicola]